MKQSFRFIVSMLFLASVQAQEVLRIVPPDHPGDKRSLCYIELLKLALDKTGGGTKLQQIEEMEQERQISSLAHNEQLDVMWTMTSKSREEKVRPIRIPLLKGLLGYRIFIIRKADQAKFRAIKTLDDLKKYTAGQGLGWPDTEILQHNLGLSQVTTAARYPVLFDMLQAGRFDYFPRGLHEPYDEIEPPGSIGYGKGFVVDDHVLIRYKSPVFFFVNKSNTALAERIEKGLHLAIKDGSFDRVFMKYMASVLSRANLKNRVVFDFENPYGSEETRALSEEKALWYNIDIKNKGQ